MSNLATGPQDASAIWSEDLTVTGVTPGAPDLAATFYLPADGPADARLPGLLVGHGAGSNRARHAPFCRAAAAAGLAVLAFDYRGHGESDGIADGPLEDDVLAALAVLRRQPAVDPARVAYRGSSMGGYYGLRAAVPGRLAALALVCPATEEVLVAGLTSEAVAAAAEAGVRIDPHRLREFWSERCLADVARGVTCPVLLLQARGDHVVPVASTLTLAGALAGPTEVVLEPGGDHGSLQSSPNAHMLTAAWLLERLCLTSSSPRSWGT